MNDDAISARVIDRWESGVGWMVHPEEPLERASHALGIDGQVWVVDPVDFDGLDELLAELGEVAGVVVGLDRHTRDATAIANRHGVAVHLPRPLGHVAGDLDAPTTVFDGTLADTGYRTIPVVDNRLWSEVALYHEERGTLLVPEAVGTADYYVAPGERLGVHPALRPWPPRRALYDLELERLLVGHGEGIGAGAASALDGAIGRARRTAPRLYAKTFTEALGLS